MATQYHPALCQECGAAPPLCDACLGRGVMWHTGTAISWGELYGRSVRRVATGVWPEYDSPAGEKLRGIAARKVQSLSSGDERLTDALARAFAKGAARGYG